MQEKIDKVQGDNRNLKDTTRKMRSKMKELTQQSEGRNKELGKKAEELQNKEEWEKILQDQIEELRLAKVELKNNVTKLKQKLKEEKQQHDAKKKDLVKKMEEFSQYKDQSEEKMKSQEENIVNLQWNLDQLSISKEAADLLVVCI